MMRAARVLAFFHSVGALFFFSLLVVRLTTSTESAWARGFVNTDLERFDSTFARGAR